MTQGPPPPGWGQQQPRPPGWEQQQPGQSGWQRQPPEQAGWQQPGPPGWERQPPGQAGWPQPWSGQGYPPPAPKRRAGRIIGFIVGAVLVLGGGGTAAVFLMNYNKSVGIAASADPLPAQCQVAPQVLAPLTTTAFAGVNARDLGAGDFGLKSLDCGWRPPESESVHDRQLNVTIAQYGGPDAAQRAHKALIPAAPGERAQPLPGFGDQALAVSLDGESSFSGAELRTVLDVYSVTITYKGWDKTFFSTAPIPPQESLAAVRNVATEVLKNLQKR